MFSPKNSNRSIRTEYPYIIEKFSSITVLLNDGIKLAATIWMPKNKNEEIRKEEKFATILEYLPYRKSDWTSIRDEIRLKYFSGFGYVSLRVDIRGTGNSQGIFDDEYSHQEHTDMLQTLQWIQNQIWSNGKVVIYGKSWGGFNGLQLGSLQSKNLVGIISAYSTDDRYSDDIHYCGGCLPAQEALTWSTQMLLWLSVPPHPIYQGGIDENFDLESIWKERLNNLVPLDCYWMKHQTRDDYWRHGSVCEDYSKITCPVLLIGGFADLYTDPVFRLMSKLECPKRALLGPWGHNWPDEAYPGPQIGFLQEVIAWLDYHIKGIDNGYDKKEILSIYKLNPNINELHSIVEERKGEWIHLNQIPNYPYEHDQRNNLKFNKEQEEEENLSREKYLNYYLSFGSLQTEIISKNVLPNKISFLSPQETGLTSGNWLGSGSLHTPDHSIDQRIDDGNSLCFDSLPLNETLELFGFPTVKLNLSSNNSNGLICVRLCMIDENSSSSILISRGILNLTHYKSHEYPEDLIPDQIYNVDVTLSGVCVCLPAGCRLRLSLSSSYWPFVWPSSQLSTLTIHFNNPSPCILTLPRLIENYSSRNDFHRPEIAQGIAIKQLSESSSQRIRTIDEINEIVTLKINGDDGCIEYPDGLIFHETIESIYQINKNDPQSARIEIERNIKYYFKDQSLLKADIKTKSIMFSKQSPSTFHLIHQLNIKNKDQEFFNKTWNLTFPRLYN
ncbi:unnamed protein product [Adineta steineri]|uniref:Xaa-Pro dipeptidyl-peptidase C-terminal domain-containing protein n=1 Tax=Adineta steineri TaxID=433720 RepID=A0A818KVJ5_9BILA|nr:unnamed protein product [Adineta steineri]